MQGIDKGGHVKGPGTKIAVILHRCIMGHQRWRVASPLTRCFSLVAGSGGPLDVGKGTRPVANDVVQADRSLISEVEDGLAKDQRFDDRRAAIDGGRQTGRTERL